MFQALPTFRYLIFLAELPAPRHPHDLGVDPLSDAGPANLSPRSAGGVVSLLSVFSEKMTFLSWMWSLVHFLPSLPLFLVSYSRNLPNQTLLSFSPVLL